MAREVSDNKAGLLLSNYRVLDLTDEKAVMCPKMLADLGADVIKVGKPGGDHMRRIGPFYHDVSDSERSIFWFTFNTRKRSITLNIETADGEKSSGSSIRDQLSD